MSDQQPPPPYGFGPPPAQPPTVPGPYGGPPGPYGPPPGPYGGGPGQPWGYPPPPQRSRRPWLIGCSAAAVVVLAIGGTIGYLVWDRMSSLGTHRLVPPAAFRGMNRQGNEATEQQLRDKLAASWDSSTSTKGRITPVAAVYGGAAHGRFVVLGGYGRIADADTEVDQLFAGVNEGTLGARKTYDAGPLGGELQCAPLKTTRLTYGVCAWADGSSVAMVMDNSQTTVDLDALAKDVRSYRQLAEVAK